MTKVAEFVEWLNDPEQLKQLMAEAIMFSDDTIVEMMDHVSYDQSIGNEANALLGSTFHYLFDDFLGNNKESIDDGTTWYQLMSDDKEPGDTAIAEQDAQNRFNARTPL
jgi:hypothetical protein